jgi:hypothetical protein
MADILGAITALEPTSEATAGSRTNIVGLEGYGAGTSGFLHRYRLHALLLGAAVMAGLLWIGGKENLAITLGSIVVLVVGFRGCVATLRFILCGSHPLIGVARAIVEEAISTRLSILLVMAVFVTLPTLPLLLDPTERLAYRLQFFLIWSLSGASILLSVLSIALACVSITDDIDSRRIHMTLSKPIQRWEYLLGKWFGVCLLNIMLVTLIGVGVAAFTFALSRLPAISPDDRLAVNEQVLTARSVSLPRHPRGEEFDKTIEATIDEIRLADPVTFAKDPTGARKRIFSQKIHEWHTVTADVISSFVFDGLDPQEIEASVVQLRLEPFADNSNIARADVRFAVWLNDRPFPMLNGEHKEYTVQTGMVHTIDLPVEAIDENGRLKLTVANRNLVMAGEDFATSIAFTPGEGLEILYRTGGFTGNFLKGLFVIWAKLAMISAVAVFLAAWLGLPTALLASLMVYVTALASSFFADAIDIYTGLDRPDATATAMLRLRASMLAQRLLKCEWWDAIKTVGSYFADGFLALVPAFGDYDAVTQLATGRAFPLLDVVSVMLIFAVAYPAGLLLLGWFLLERRDVVGATS